MAGPALASSAIVAPYAPDTASRRRWAICGLLFAATFLNYLDREVLSVVSPVLRLQFHLTATAYSHLLTAFLLGYTVLQAYAGRAIDWMGARRGLLLAMLWWSGAGLLAGFARGPYQLGACLFLMGVGESANWPAAVKTTQQWFAPKQRGIAVAIFNCGSAAGAVAAPIVITVLTLRYSWRAAFAASGALGLLWVLPWLITFRRERHAVAGEASLEGPGPSWFDTLRKRNTLALMGARFLADPLWIFFVFWLPDYLNRSRHFSMARIGATAWLPFLTAGLGNLAGGALSSSLMHRGVRARSARVRVMAVSAVLMLSGVSISFLSSPAMMLAAISLITFAYSCWAANILTLPADLFGGGEIATVIGLTGTAAGCGSMLVMLLVGILVDHVSYLPVLIGISCMPIFALLCVLLTRSGEDI
jgi:MFS transporter, ACS family, hexuronate transporter